MTSPPVALPKPDPTLTRGGPVMWTWTYAEPSNCYFVRAAGNTARTDSIWNAALAWYGIDPDDPAIVRWTQS